MPAIVSLAAIRGYLEQISSIHEDHITEASVRQFNTVLGDPNELIISPTWFTRLRAGEIELVSRFGLRLEQLLHAEQEYCLEGGEFAVGNTLSYLTRFTHLQERSGKSGPMAFLTFETEVTSNTNAKVKIRTLIVVRGVSS